MTSIHQSRALADVVADKLRVFGQPQRLMILSYLLGGARQVADIEKATGINQPALSQQPAELRRADLVKFRRDAKLVHYRLSAEAVEACVRTLEAMFGEDGIRPAAVGKAAKSGAVERKPRPAVNLHPAMPIAAAAFAQVEHG